MANRRAACKAGTAEPAAADLPADLPSRAAST